MWIWSTFLRRAALAAREAAVELPPGSAAMLTVSLRRKIVLLLLVAVLATPWASAASLLPESPRVAQALDSVPLVGSVWRLLRSVWNEEGCRIDPNGQCASMKEGCRLDPDGRCVKEGCMIDPNGLCASRPAKNPPPPQPKEGCRIDPNGRCLS
jgi:hypothetical protein